MHCAFACTTFRCYVVASLKKRGEKNHIWFIRKKLKKLCQACFFHLLQCTNYCSLFCWQIIRATETQVLVGLLGDKLPLAAELVSELWNAKVKAEYMVHKKVMKLIDRARESKIPWMVIVGERELNEGIVKLKNIDTTQEEVISRSNFVEEIQRRLNR